ncbi:hypothetical protein [Aliamphritea hakodatensis]|uniref:hypothetical protein n=1 Tax=Aliamphritea hakodatensis TaxID=2895352 RepID=UPI0022FDACA0|nr:hypothetical protein [Aliamphritea hakodatensis]
MELHQIKSLSGEELKNQAKTLDINVTGNMKDETIQKKIIEKLGLTDDSEGGVGKAGNNESGKSADSGKERMVTVRIQGDKDNKQPVPVAVNGRVLRIKRNEDVQIPESFLEVLKNAKQLQYEENSKGELESSEVFSYQFSVLG